jgi:L-malate glycosyltransferase
MIRVLLISNMYPSKEKPYSGIFVKNQFEALRSHPDSLDIDICFMERRFTGIVESALKYLNFFVKFSSYLTKNYNVIHVHYFSYHVFFALIYKLFNRDTKLVVTLHGSDSGNVGKILFSNVSKFIDCFIAVGTQQASEIKKTILKVPVYTIPAGIDSSVFYPIVGIKKKYDYIFVGSFYPIKGADILITAISILNDTTLTYCFVGSGSFDSDINELKKRSNIDLRYDQTQSQLRELYAQSRYLVLPTRGDSFGLVVSEAMYCGTPVIVSNVGGMKDQVVDGFNGYILAENTPFCLAEKMEYAARLEETKYKQLATNAATSNELYSLENITNRLVQLYHSL